MLLKEKSRQKKSSCSGKMWTTTSLLVCVCSLGVSRVCADPDFLKVNLLEEVDNPRIIHQSVNISWLNKPPYIYDENSARSGKNREKLSEKTTNSTEEAQVKQENVKGIFYEIINKGLQLCDVISRGGANFTMKAQDLQQLDQSIVNEKIDFAMPVHGSDDGKYGGYEYVEILKSPGVVFIVNREETKEHLRKQVAQAMKDTWPVIVITLLLTGFAGLIIWGLVSSRLCRKIFCLLYLKNNKYDLIISVSRLGRIELRELTEDLSCVTDAFEQFTSNWRNWTCSKRLFLINNNSTLNLQLNSCGKLFAYMI